MLVQSHETDGLVPRPALSRVGDAWATEVVPRLPADRAAPARALQALQRVRGVLASVLGPLAPRRLGAWAVLLGRAAISEAAWRQRLRARNDGLRWRLSALRAAPEPPTLPCPRPAGRRGLVAARPLGQPGGTGDAWRRPLAYACTAGRMHPGRGTARHGGAPRAPSAWQAGDGLGRRPPAPFPLATETALPCPGRRWRRHHGSPERDRHGWGRWAGRREAVRRVAAQLDPAAPRRARRRTRRQAPQAGRPSTAPTLAVAGWRGLLTPLDAGTGSTADVR